MTPILVAAIFTALSPVDGTASVWPPGQFVSKVVPAKRSSIHWIAWLVSNSSVLAWLATGVCSYTFEVVWIEAKYNELYSHDGKNRR